MDLTLVLAFVVLLGLSAAFSGSETALCSITRVKAVELEKQSKRGKALQRWIDDPEKYLTTILIGNNIANVATASLATMVTTKALGPGKSAEERHISILIR